MSSFEQTVDRVPEPGHLRRLLFSGAMAAHRGEYRPVEGWTVSLGKGPDSMSSRLVTLHEQMHGELNDSTAFGTALHLYAFLAANRGPQDAAHSTFNSLLHLCERTHECFATYVSLSVFSDVADPATVLAPYPQYLEYFETADSLCRTGGPEMRYRGVSNALRVCMQTPILEAILDTGIESFTPGCIRSRDGPGHRLQLVRSLLSERLWSDLIASIPRQLPDVGWEELYALDLDPSRRSEVLDAPFRRRWELVGHYIFDRIADKLRREGIRTLEYDGHVDETDSLLEAANTLVQHAVTRRLVSSARTETRADYELESLAEERLHISEPIRASLSDLAGVEDAHLSEFVSHQPSSHFFVVVRQARRLLEQYVFSAAAASRLRSRGTEPVVALRRERTTPTEGDERIGLWVLDSPQLVDQLKSSAASELGVLSSISLAVLSDIAWRERWLETLQSATLSSILVDMSPFAQLRVLGRRREAKVDYSVLNVRVGESQRGVLVYRPRGSGTPFVTPCSDMVLAAILHYMTDRLADSGVFEEDRSWPKLVYEPLTAMMMHLFREEPWFDFRASRHHEGGQES